MDWSWPSPPSTGNHGDRNRCCVAQKQQIHLGKGHCPCYQTWVALCLWCYEENRLGNLVHVLRAVHFGRRRFDRLGISWLCRGFTSFLLTCAWFGGLDCVKTKVSFVASHQKGFHSDPVNCVQYYNSIQGIKQYFWKYLNVLWPNTSNFTPIPGKKA